MLIQEISVSSIIKELKKNQITSYYFLDELFIEYLLKYNPTSKFEDKSFIIKSNDNILYCPITIEKKNDKKYLNFFGEPCFCIYIKYDNKIFEHLINKIKEIFENENITDVNLVIEQPETKFNDQKDFFFKENSYIKISKTKYIDLNLTIQEIKKGFKKGLKHLLSKDYSSLSYLIINKENYDKEILNMKKMHQEVSKKITRSHDTWMINEKMILLNKGFLVKVIDASKTISYSLFFNNGKQAIYFSSCTLKEYFNIYQNITHKSIFEAIKYLKKIECNKLTLGITKIIFSEETVSKKEQNISMFKSSFGGKVFVRHHLNKKILDL